MAASAIERKRNSSKLSQPLWMGSGVSQDPSTFLLTFPNYCEHIFIDPQFQFWTKLMHVRLKCFFHVFIKKSIISRFPFQINIGYIAYTRMIDLKFEIAKNGWGGACRAPSTDPFPALSRILLLIRASPDSDPRVLTRGRPIAMSGGRNLF